MNAGGPRAKAPNKNQTAKKKSIISTHLQKQMLTLTFQSKLLSGDFS
jgi:hypothetical protein